MKIIKDAASQADGWFLKRINTTEYQTFYIKENLEQKRIVKTTDYILTVYMDFKKDQKLYRGASTIKLSDLNSPTEVKNKIAAAIISAQSVETPWFPLGKGPEELPTGTNSFSRHPLPFWLPTLTEAVFKAKSPGRSWINTLEVFLKKEEIHLENSNGLELEYEIYHGHLDLVVTAAHELSGEVELHKELSFSDFEPEALLTQVEHLHQLAIDRSKAYPLPKSLDCPVILTGNATRDFFSYYLYHGNKEAAFKGASPYELGQVLNEAGDKLTLQALPLLYNSPYTHPVNHEGVLYKKLLLYKDGKLEQRGGSTQYSYYYETEANPISPNFTVTPGSFATEDLKGKSYLEVVSFSDFQMDTISGDFGGEIRLAYYFDGEKRIPVTGGSVSSSIMDCQKNYRFSTAMMTLENYEGPAYVYLNKMNIAGV